MQHPHSPRHRQPRLHLHGGGGPHPINAAEDRERVDGESGGHILSSAGVDVTGGDEHEADLPAGVDELEGAVVVGEGGTVRVSDGGVLGEGEVDGAVREGEGREADGGDGDVRVVRFEESKVKDEKDDNNENQEGCGDQTRRQVGAP